MKRLMGRLLVLVLGVSLLLPGAKPAAANTLFDTQFACNVNYDSNWWCLPVAHIRVKRMSKPGQPVEQFTLDYWIKNSLPKEIDCSSPNLSMEVKKATAIALKMYGWARHLKYGHSSPTDDRAIRTYDVTDDSSDGVMFVEGSATPACDNVLSATNGIMLVRDYTGAAHGTIFEAEWRKGTYAPVTSAMANSDRMQQWNAQYEIYNGRWSTWQDILWYFYDSYHIQYY